MLDPKVEQRPTAREVLVQLRVILNRPKRRLGMAVAASVALLAAFGAWRYTTDLQAERAIAEAQRVQAEAARGDAENLVNFMLDELNSGLQSVGRLDLLESVADEAMSYYNGLNTAQLQDAQSGAAVAMVRLAEAIELQGRKEDALVLLDRAFTALESLHVEDPDNELAVYQLGFADMVAGEIYKISGDYTAAHRHSERGIELGRQLTAGIAPGESPTSNPGAIERWRLLLRSLYMDADVSMRSGDRVSAATVLDEAAPLAVAAAEKEPGLRSTLADIQFKRCDTYYDMSRSDLALQACLSVMALDEELYEADPENYRLRSNFAMDHLTVSRVYSDLHQTTEALAIAEQGIAHFRELVEWEESNASTLNDLASMLIVNARIQQKLNDTVASLDLFREAYEILQPLAQDGEEITYLNNQFTVLLHLGELEQARKLATELVSRGFGRREFIDLCREFDVAECERGQ